MTTEHEHKWGPVEHARFTGNPHRKCECGMISLDLGGDEESDDLSPLPDVNTLAKAFSDEMRAGITAEELAEVNKRNVAEGEGSLICHSHDFCDANMVMYDAWAKVTGAEPPVEFIVNDDRAQAVWQDAWSIAKKANFSL